MFSAPAFVGYAFPAVVDLFGDAAPELIWGHNSYLNAVLSAAAATPGGSRSTATTPRCSP